MRALLTVLRPTPPVTCGVGDYLTGGADLPCPQRPEQLVVAMCPACGLRAEAVCTHHAAVLGKSMSTGEAICAGLCELVGAATPVEYCATYEI